MFQFVSNTSETRKKQNLIWELIGRMNDLDYMSFFKIFWNLTQIFKEPSEISVDMWLEISHLFHWEFKIEKCVFKK